MNKVWQLKIAIVFIFTSFKLLAQDASDWHTKPILTTYFEQLQPGVLTTCEEQPYQIHK